MISNLNYKITNPLFINQEENPSQYTISPTLRLTIIITIKRYLNSLKKKQRSHKIDLEKLKIMLVFVVVGIYLALGFKYYPAIAYYSVGFVMVSTAILLKKTEWKNAVFLAALVPAFLGINILQDNYHLLPRLIFIIVILCIYAFGYKKFKSAAITIKDSEWKILILAVIIIFLSASLYAASVNDCFLLHGGGKGEGSSSPEFCKQLGLYDGTTQGRYGWILMGNTLQNFLTIFFPFILIFIALVISRLSEEN